MFERRGPGYISYAFIAALHEARLLRETWEDSVVWFHEAIGEEPPPEFVAAARRRSGDVQRLTREQNERAKRLISVGVAPERAVTEALQCKEAADD